MMDVEMSLKDFLLLGGFIVSLVVQSLALRRGQELRAAAVTTELHGLRLELVQLRAVVGGEQGNRIARLEADLATAVKEIGRMRDRIHDLGNAAISRDGLRALARRTSDDETSSPAWAPHTPRKGPA